ncbi:hypothetical protein ACJ72_08471, partial [Emergomyces africanus]
IDIFVKDFVNIKILFLINIFSDYNQVILNLKF